VQHREQRDVGWVTLYLGREIRRGRFLVPGERLEIIVHELLVEARWALACRIAVGRPEARGVEGQGLLDQDQIALPIERQLEFGVGDGDATRAYPAASV
jgi:hypothetical protein